MPILEGAEQNAQIPADCMQLWNLRNMGRTWQSDNQSYGLPVTKVE